MKRLLDLLWLVLLGLFCFGIAPTFHGDEPMQIYMSSDFQTAILDRNPSALTTEPPYSVDTDPYLRLINGTINRYGIGLGWYLAGMKASDLPPRPGWDWGLDYDTNVSTGHMPSAALLQASRFSSTLFLALSAAVMFGLGWQFGAPNSRRPTAYFVSALYIANPIILLNGRRALQEGSMLFFGLLLIWIAVLIARRRSEQRPTPIYLWIALTVGAALALASKYTDIVFVAAAFAWIFLTKLMRLKWRDLLLTALRLMICAALAGALFVALSPALWSDPPARIVDMLQMRADLLDIQVQGTPTTMQQRLESIVTEPFTAPLQHFEVAFWGDFQPVADDIARYMASPFSGLQFGVILGGGLTLLAGAGIVFSLRRGRRVGVLIWFALTAASLMANPLPWQRYYLPLIPVMTLLAGIGLFGLARFVRKPEQAAVLSHPEAQTE